jgi:hypothetical protein
MALFNKNKEDAVDNREDEVNKEDLNLDSVVTPTLEEAQTGEKLDAKQLARKAKTEIKQSLYEQLKDSIAGNEDATKLLQQLRPSLYGLSNTGCGGTAKHTTFGDMFTNVGDVVDELTVFKALKVGPVDGKKFCRKLIAKSTPDERKWVHYDLVNCEYTLTAIGADVPPNWVGYTPDANEVPEIENTNEDDTI